MIRKPLRSGSKYEQVVLSGSWHPAGTGTTAPTDVRGDGFTVAQSASGVFDVTFTDPYAQCVSFVPSIQVDGETTDATVQAGDVTAATGARGEIRRIRAMTAGTPTNFSGDAGSRVGFVAVYNIKT